LARHDPKKKKTPEEPEDSDSKELPPTEPVQNEEEKSYTKKKLDQLFWLRIALAVLQEYWLHSSLNQLKVKTEDGAQLLL